MKFDIINLTQEEINALTVVQTKLLRTAQQKKDELVRKADKEREMFKKLIHTTGMVNSSLPSAKEREIQDELEFQIAYLADNLIYNMSLNEPATPDDVGGDNGDESAGYIVDYSLSYNERYILVRDYYLAIPDPNERMALYSSDETARKYLASYYATLYNILYTYSK